MHLRPFRISLTAAAWCAAALAATSVANAAGTERASIIPEVNAFPGPAVSGGGGYSAFVNGVSDYWSTTPNGTVSFLVFVFPGAQVTQDVTFTVMPPSGEKPVYTYTFKAQNISVTGTWLSVAATGDYSKTGTYSAIVTAGGVEIGRIPLVFAPASK